MMKSKSLVISKPTSIWQLEISRRFAEVLNVVAMKLITSCKLEYCQAQGPSLGRKFRSFTCSNLFRLFHDLPNYPKVITRQVL